MQLVLITITIAGVSTFLSLAGQNPSLEVDGVVIDSTTREPLGGATVIAAAGAITATAVSDSGGRFSLTLPGPGKYLFRPILGGFVAGGVPVLDPLQRGLWAGVTGPGRSLVLELVREGVISGSLVDSDGVVWPGVLSVVTIHMLVYDGNGMLRLGSDEVTSRFARVDDRGEFRFADLVPGEYYVRAGDATGGLGSSLVLKGGLYPGVQSLADADAIHVGAGEEVRLRPLILNRESGTRLRMHLLGAPKRRISVVVTDGNENATMLATPPGQDGPDWVTMPPMASGPHDLYVVVTPVDGSGPVTAALNVVLSGEEMDVEVPLRPAHKISGRVVMVDSRSEQDAVSVVGCRLQPMDLRYISRTKPCVGIAVPPGSYRLAFDSMPSDAYVSSARLGDSDILAGDLRIEDDVHIEVRLARNGASVAGVVSDDRGARVANARIALVPDSPARDAYLRYKSGLSDAEGRFELRGVAPGSYRLFSWRRLAGDAFRNSDFLQRYEDRGIAIAVDKESRDDLGLIVLD